MNVEFKKGDLVEMTKEAIRSGLDGLSRRRIGTVCTVFDDGTMTVHRHGDMAGKRHKYSQTYWKPHSSQNQNPS